MRTQGFSLGIGDMVWGVHVQDQPAPACPEVYQPFVVAGSPTQTLTIWPDRPAPDEPLQRVFETDATWSLHQAQASYVLTMLNGRAPRVLRHWVRLSRDFQLAELFSSPLSNIAELYPFDQLWAMHLLAGRDGLLLHGCGVSHRGRGLLFLGHSGEGKTTMARLWSSVREATILSDERVIVQKIGGRYLLYGTPWHGQGVFAAPGPVPLQHVMILSHGRANSMNPLTGSGAVAAVLARSLTPYWHQALTDDCLGTVAGLCRACPVDRLEVVPDAGVVDFLLSHV
jgi:hypothetical protein